MKLVPAIVATALTVLVAGSGSTLAACTADLAEPDDSCFVSKSVLHGGQVVARNFCDDATDWPAFNACTGRTYTIRTLSLGVSADTVVEIYAPDCSTLLASDDNGGGGAASLLNWTAPDDGVFHLKVRQADGTAGDDRTYDIELVGDTSTCATWANRYDAPPGSEFSMIYFGAIADGGFVSSGFFYSGGDALFDAWIARMDAGGRVVWQRTFGSEEDHVFTGKTVQTADGGFAVLGSLANIDPAVMKLDASGSIQWQRSYGGFRDDVFADAAATPDGGLILAGTTNSFGTSTNRDIWVLKLTATGDVEWSKTYGGEGDEQTFAIAATGDGGFIVVGNTDSFGPSGGNGWVLKVDATGAIVWQKAYVGSFQFTVMALTTDGDVVVSGSGSSLKALRLDAAGAIVWQKTYSGNHGASDSLSPTSDGGVVIGGQYFENSELDGRLLRLDAAGNVVWNKRDFTPPVFEGAVGVPSVEETPDGGLVVWRYLGFVDSILRTDASGSVPSCATLTDTPTTASNTTAVAITTTAVAQVVTVSSAVTTVASTQGATQRTGECPCQTAESSPGSLTCNTPITGGDLLVDFGDGDGLWVYADNSSWSLLLGVRPEIVVTGDLDGNGVDEVIVDLGDDGIWIYDNFASWRFLHGLTPTKLGTADFDGNGQEDLIVDFGPGEGLWIYDNNTSWRSLHGLSPKFFTSGDFDGNGQDDLLVDFGPGIGVWIYVNNFDWAYLHDLSPESATVANLNGNALDDLVVDFGDPYGVYVLYDASSWYWLHGLSPVAIEAGDIDGTGTDELIVNFGAPNGVWIYENDTSWSLLDGLSPELIRVADMNRNGKDDLVVDLGANGLRVYSDGSTWRFLHGSSPFDVTVGEFGEPPSSDPEANSSTAIPTRSHRRSAHPPRIPPRLPSGRRSSVCAMPVSLRGSPADIGAPADRVVPRP